MYELLIKIATLIILITLPSIAHPLSNTNISITESYSKVSVTSWRQYTTPSSIRIVKATTATATTTQKTTTNTTHNSIDTERLARWMNSKKSKNLKAIVKSKQLNYIQTVGKVPFQTVKNCPKADSSDDSESNQYFDARNDTENETEYGYFVQNCCCCQMNSTAVPSKLRNFGTKFPNCIQCCDVVFAGAWPNVDFSRIADDRLGVLTIKTIIG